MMVWRLVLDDGCPWPPPMPMTGEEHRAYESACAIVTSHELAHLNEGCPAADQCPRCAALTELRALVDHVRDQQASWIEQWHTAHHAADQAALDRSATTP